MRDESDHEIIKACLQHIDEALITLEKYEDVLTIEEKNILNNISVNHSLWEKLLVRLKHEKN